MASKAPGEGDFGLHHVTCWNRKHQPGKVGIRARWPNTRCVACGQPILIGERICWRGRNRAIA